MRAVRILKSQTLTDIAIQELGDVTRVLEIAVMNDLSITDPLTAGETILVPDALIEKLSITKLFKETANAPASDDEEEEIIAGIGDGSAVITLHDVITQRSILEGQTIIDLATQDLGDPERAMEIAVLNDRSITDHLVPGELLETPTAEESKYNMLRLFSNPANAPASDETDVEIIPVNEGIGYWRIENDFIVQ